MKHIKVKSHINKLIKEENVLPMSAASMRELLVCAYIELEIDTPLRCGRDFGQYHSAFLLPFFTLENVDRFVSVVVWLGTGAVDQLQNGSASMNNCYKTWQPKDALHTSAHSIEKHNELMLLEKIFEFWPYQIKLVKLERHKIDRNNNLVHFDRFLI